MSFVLGIDLGTSSIKSLLLDIASGETWTGQIEYQYEIPKIGFAEQDVNVWWDAMVQSIHVVMQKSAVSKGDIKALGFSGQMHGIVPLDKDFVPIQSAIIWCDQRSADLVERYSDEATTQFFEKHTANKLHAGFGFASLLWLKENEPEKYRKISKICCPKDYLRYRLTGQLKMEQTDAAGILAFDVKNGRWSEEILDRFEINPSIFPAVKYPTDYAGNIISGVANEIGLSETCSVYFGGADQVMQAIGNGVINPGDTSVTIGTGGQILSILDKPCYHKSLNAHTFNFAMRNTWYFMGATLSAGQSLKWLKQQILHMKDYKMINQLAAEKPCGSNGLIFLPYLIGERTPHSDGKASGMYIGLNMVSDRGSLIRSLLEGVAFSLKDCISMLSELGVTVKSVVSAGGGAYSPLWLQIQADIFNMPIYVSKNKEQAALGAAITAAVGHGMFDSYQEAIKKFVEYDSVPIKPIQENANVYRDYYEIYKKLYSSNKEHMHALSELAKRKD